MLWGVMASYDVLYVGATAACLSVWLAAGLTD